MMESIVDFDFSDCTFSNNPFSDHPLDPFKNALTQGDIAQAETLLDAYNYPLNQEELMSLLMRAQQAPCALVEKILNKGASLCDLSYYEQSQALIEFLQNDRADVVTLLIAQIPAKQINLQAALEIAIFNGALSCVKLLLSHQHTWTVTPSLQKIWTCLYGGNPTLDASIALLAPHLMDIAPNEKIPFLPQMSLDDALTFDSPRALHQLISQLPPSTNLNTLFSHLHSICLGLFDANDFGFVFLEIPTPIQNGSSYTSNDNPLPPIDTTTLSSLVLALFKQFPRLDKSRAFRELIVTLALMEHPHPDILTCAQGLSGKQLVISSFHTGWLGEAQLLSRWAERLPRLQPTIIRTQFPFHNRFHLDTDCRPWLEQCHVTGALPKEGISALADAILNLENDDPYFLAALEPNGVLYQERRNLLKAVCDTYSTASKHYFMALTMLTRGEEYAL